MEQLKPCPFCGGEASVIGVPEDYGVACGVCECELGVDNASCACYFFDNKNEAIEAWNKRVDNG